MPCRRDYPINSATASIIKVTALGHSYRLFLRLSVSSSIKSLACLTPSLSELLISTINKPTSKKLRKASPSTYFTMFDRFSKPFLGLRGRKLNIAIAAVAGVDML